jgi:hypothetical protein
LPFATAQRRGSGGEIGGVKAIQGIDKNRSRHVTTRPILKLLQAAALYTVHIAAKDVLDELGVIEADGMFCFEVSVAVVFKNVMKLDDVNLVLRALIRVVVPLHYNEAFTKRLVVVVGIVEQDGVLIRLPLPPKERERSI